MYKQFVTFPINHNFKFVLWKLSPYNVMTSHDPSLGHIVTIFGAYFYLLP